MSGRRKSGPDGGFTLMEMLLVLALMAMVAAIALPIARRQNDTTALKATTLQFASLMRSARGAAIRENTDKTLTVDLGARRFWVDGLTRGHTIARGIDVRLAEAAPGGGRLRFFADGSAGGGSVVLTSGADTAEITLDALTGTPRLRWGR